MLSFACFCCRQGEAQSSCDTEMSCASSERHSVRRISPSTKLTTRNTTHITSSNSQQSTNGNNQHSTVENANSEQPTYVPKQSAHNREQCPKALKTATNCQKEKRKFRKLRFSSFRKNTLHHPHNYSSDIINFGNLNPDNAHKNEMLSISDCRTELFTSSGATTTITIAGVSHPSKAVNYSSFESIISSINSSNSFDGSTGTHGSECFSSAGYNLHKAHNCVSSEDDGTTNAHQNVTLLQPCETVASTSHNIINKSTFV